MIISKLVLHLVNFKCIKEKSITFSSKYILLDGASGSGKTSILQALLFALTGEGKNIVHFGQRSCKVTLEIYMAKGVIIITRTKTPNNLKVAIGDNISEDALAQYHLNKLFNANFIKFAFVSQNTFGFLSMQPNERFKLIKSMIVNEEKLEFVKQNCKLLKAKRQKQFDVISGKLEAYETIQNVQVGSAGEPHRALGEIKSELSKLTAFIGKAEADNYCRANILAKLSQFKPLAIKTISLELEQLKALIPFISLSEKGTLCKTKTFLKAVDAIPYKLLQDQKQKQTRLLHSLIEEESKLGLYTDCPCCKAPLFLNANFKLLKLEGEPKLSCKKLVNFNRLDEKISTCNQVLQEINATLETMVVPEPTILTDLENCTDNLQQLYNAAPENGTIELWHQYNTLDKLNVKLVELEQLKKESLAHEQVKTLELPPYTELASYNDKQKKLYKELSDAELAEASKLYLLKKGAKINKQLSSDSLGRSIGLIALVNEAEAHHMDLNLMEINLLLNSLIIRLTNGTISACLLPETNGTSQKLKIVVYNKGQETDHNTLSGGETSRLNIAMALVLVKFKKLPFLILDEATSSLDQETAFEVLTHVQAEFKEFIFCVAHQAVTGMFEEVLTVTGEEMGTL